jgi:acyl carrier protein
MNNSNEKKLKEILAKVLLVEKTRINDGMSRKDVKEWDSMAHLMLVSEIESEFGVMISDDDITEIKTVSDIKRVLRKLDVDI